MSLGERGKGGEIQGRSSYEADFIRPGPSGSAEEIFRGRRPITEEGNVRKRGGLKGNALLVKRSFKCPGCEKNLLVPLLTGKTGKRREKAKPGRNPLLRRPSKLLSPERREDPLSRQGREGIYPQKRGCWGTTQILSSDSPMAESLVFTTS